MFRVCYAASRLSSVVSLNGEGRGFKFVVAGACLYILCRYKLHIHPNTFGLFVRSQVLRASHDYTNPRFPRLPRFPQFLGFARCPPFSAFSAVCLKA